MTSQIAFRAPARSWLDCLPLGNGSLGAMLDGDPSVTLMRLNDDTAWSGSPRSELGGGAIGAADAAHQLALARAAIDADDPVAAEAALRPLQVPWSQAYLPFATVALGRAAETDGDYRRMLDLGTGIHELVAGTLREESFTSAVHGVFAHRIQGAGDIRVELSSPHHVLRSWNGPDEAGVLIRLPSDVAPGHEPESPAAVWSDDAGSSIEGALVVGIAREGDATLVVVATETTFAGLGRPLEGTAETAAGRARARVDRALQDGWTVVRAAHVADHTGLLGGVELDLGKAPIADDGGELSLDERLARAETHSGGAVAADPALVALLFDYGRYLLAASSRPGSLPATLQGIWNDEMRPPWSSNYTININTQMNYWSAYSTGLPECGEPLLDFVSALAVAGTPTARRLYDAPGWAAHHNSDAWLLTNPVGAGHGDARWTAWPLASLWLVTHISDAVAYGAISAERLAELWPAVRGAAEFALAWTREDPDGRWVTSPATSPENAYRTDAGIAAVDSTTAMDLTLVRAACAAAVVVGARLGVTSDEVVDAARSLVERLPAEPAIAADGSIREWSRDRVGEDPHHRHVSHLVGLYPGTTVWSPAARDAAGVTLTRRGDESSGWSVVWKAILWARLGRGDRAADVMNLLFRRADRLEGPFAGGLYANLFAAHPPFQIDANLGFPALIAEMLVQSHDGIELLPALPPALADGRVRGLVARPGVEVDLSWGDGSLVEVRLRALAGGEGDSLRVRYAGVELVRELPADGELVLRSVDFRQSAEVVS
ncbi:glycosyl hydrolase family 95 catalytic domain-containing protein [Microbacterium pumilum]|uniref:Glycoside hydrolase N-terminal domain-containing protein n=1 Tax=Microbacterium pumilum TaxID=344165 RepID=A0ABP5EH25_9MICO